MAHRDDQSGASFETDDGLSDPLEWFHRAVSREPEVGSFVVDGCEINSLAWGSRTLPTLVLVHGGRAHARWWNFVGPLLADHHRVVAVDLSGHGDSGRRDRYGLELWATEIVTAASTMGGAGSPIVAGHSMGGRVTSVVAARYGTDLEGAIILDARLGLRSSVQSGPFRPLRVYPTREAAVKRFRITPAQKSENPLLLNHVAEFSLREVDGGWTWKFDPLLYSDRTDALRRQDFSRWFAKAACPVGLVFGELSAVTDGQTRGRIIELLAGSPGGRDAPIENISGAHHHLMFDRPLELVASINRISMTWRRA